MIVNTAVTVGRRVDGPAGQYAYSATVSYEATDTGLSGEYQGMFWGSVYGGPIYAPGGHRVDTAVLDRIGRTLDAEWITRFYGLDAVAGCKS